MRKRLKAKLDRIKRYTKNPMEIFAQMLEATREFADWPFPSDAEERLSGEYLAGIYATGRRGVYYAREFCREHGLEGTHNAAVFERVFAIIDELMIYDGLNVCNSAGVEYLCRWAYGLEQTYSECSQKAHCTGDKKNLRTRWDLFNRYDIYSISKKANAVRNADKAVVASMKDDALFNKYLERVRGTSDSPGY